MAGAAAPHERHDGAGDGRFGGDFRGGPADLTAFGDAETQAVRHGESLALKWGVQRDDYQRLRGNRQP